MSPSPRRLELTAVACAVALGCARFDTRVVPLGPPLPARSSRAPVRVERSPVVAPGAREVALLEVTSYRGDEDVSALFPQLETMAREAGADLVVLLRSDRAAGFLRVVASALRTR